MDLYILDEQFRPVEIFDTYNSVIWTERINPPCGIEIDTVNDARARQIFTEGRAIHIQGSDRVMIVETVTVAHDEDESLLKVLGRSTERWFDDRVAALALSGTADSEGNEIPWKITGTPGKVMREIASKSLTLQPSDANSFIEPIQDITFGSIMEADPGEFQLKAGLATELLNEIAEIYGMGWRLVKTTTPSKFAFETFTGDDRTTTQTARKPVVFGETLGNLTNLSTIRSNKDYKNVAYVFSPKAATIVYADNVDPSITGPERRVLFVEASNVDDSVTGPELLSALQKVGKDELAKHQPIAAFEGEASKASGYVYNVDYSLGDRVEFRDSSGNRSIMVVTEQTFVVDAEGSKSYPTLSFFGLTVAGSWDAYNPTQMWDDVPDDSDHEWEDLP